MNENPDTPVQWPRMIPPAMASATGSSIGPEQIARAVRQPTKAYAARRGRLWLADEVVAVLVEDDRAPEPPLVLRVRRTKKLAEGDLA